jgi:hypothetical protein
MAKGPYPPLVFGEVVRMSDRLDRLTADHRDALGRLDAQEKAARKHKRGLLLALVTALGAGGGTAAKAYFDYRAERDAIQAEAHNEATGAELDAVQWTETAEALEAVDRELGDCVERSHELDRRVSKLEVAIEFLTDDQRWIRRQADRVERAPAPSRKGIELPAYGDLEADPQRVEQRKAKILQTKD